MVTIANICDRFGEIDADMTLEKAVHRKGRQGHEGKQSTSIVIKITNLVIASGFALALIPLASLASLAVQMLDLA